MAPKAGHHGVPTKHDLLSLETWCLQQIVLGEKDTSRYPWNLVISQFANWKSVHVDSLPIQKKWSVARKL
jgi:hypothetical protein